MLRYGNDPLFEYKETVDIGNGRKATFSFIIHESEKGKAEKAVKDCLNTLRKE